MEAWEAVVESYPGAPDVRTFSKMLKTVDVSLNDDLAPFESDWIISTLFFKPVNLFEAVTTNCHDVQWAKPIGDSFKLIAVIVEKYSVNEYYENIVTLCSLPFTPQIRISALKCLSVLAKDSDMAAREWPRFVSELEEVVTGKAPLAQLVGTICEHHPHVVSDDANRVWRIYLNLLDSNKNTATVVSSVLEGLTGLFKHFGNELPVMEFRDLYARISKEYARKSGCEKATLQILERYADLFKELLAQDVALREYLWQMKHCAAIMSVYKSIATAVNKDRLQQIVDAELVPRTNSSSSDVKFTSLRITRLLVTAHGVTAKTDGHANVQVLESELKAGNITFDSGNEILWCIESNCIYSDRLLQTAILFYTNIPSTRRKQIVVYGLLNAEEDVRKGTVTLLISECCQLTEEGHNIDKYLPLWNDLLDSRGGDEVVLEKGEKVFCDVMEYLYTVVEDVLGEGSEVLPSKFSPLLTLAYHILTIQPPDHYTENHCKKLLRLLYQCMDCAVSAPLLSTITAASRHSRESLTEYCKKVRIDKCNGEAVLCEACFMLIQDGAEIDLENVLEAIEILFSRSDVDPKILVQALRRFEAIITEHEVESDRVDYIIHLIDKLRIVKNSSNKDSRIFHRDVFIFLGKYGNNNYVMEKSKENSVISKLKDKLVLNVPNTEEGTTYKLNLQQLLQLAIIYEEMDALEKLLAIICVTLSQKPHPDLQLSLTAVIHALCRVHAHSRGVDVTAVNSAVLLCRTVDCVCALLAAIRDEKSPGARKMLSDALEGALLTDPGSELTESLIRTVADEAAAMMGSHNATTRSGGLNVTETLLGALKDNHTLQKSILPDLIPLILQTEDFDSKITFQNATKILLDNIEIYDKHTIKDVVKKLVINIVKHSDLNNDLDVKLFKSKVVESACFFVDSQAFDEDLLSVVVENFSRHQSYVLFLMAEFKMELKDVVDDILENIANMDVERGVKECFEVEAALRFMQEYCDVLFEKNCELTTKAFGNVIKNLQPHTIIDLQKQLKPCISICTKHIKPRTIQEIYKDWCTKYDINKIIKDINIETISKNKDVVKALKTYTDLLDITVYDENILQISNCILNIYANKEERYLDAYRESLEDLLYISLKYNTRDGIKNFILLTYERTQLNFLRYFVAVFSKYLLVKPFVLLEEEMSPIASVLEYILKDALKQKCDDKFYKNLMELLDLTWPLQSNKLRLLSLALRLPVRIPAESRPVQWAVEATAEAGLEDKIRLVGVLPGGEKCSAAYRSLASLLPVRLSELTGSQHSALQALLDALASDSYVVLDIVANLADRDPTKGWWDEAFASSAASLASGESFKNRQEGIAKEEDDAALLCIANKLFEKQSLGVYHRLLIPLLRYSTPAFCERFFSGVLPTLLATLKSWVRQSSGGRAEYEKVLEGHARAFAVLTVVFEKVPLSSLTSQDSSLYSLVEDKQPSFLIKRACALCFALRNKDIPDNVRHELQKCYRQSQIENFKCFCAAVCVARPAEKFYGYLFDSRAWHNIVDLDKAFEMPLQSVWTQSRTFHASAANIPPEGSQRFGSTGTRTGTLRTRVFLRTLSVDPLRYDLLPLPPQEDNIQDLTLAVNELNNQPCIVPLTALVKHAASLTHHGWRGKLAEGVTSGHTNVRWTLVQVIINCKEDLKPHASELCPALLQLVVDTACDTNGKRTLNGLHVDVLDTILYWQEHPPPASLATPIQYLMNTAIANGHRTSIFGSLLSMLGKMAELYGEGELSWQGFEEHFSDPTKSKYLISVLLNITKHKIRIPTLLQTLSTLDQSLWAEPRLSELYGYALACESERGVYLSQHRKFLARRGGVEYVKMVYNVQKGYPLVVDEKIFKTIADLTPKLMGYAKTWCLKILASYVEHTTDSQSVTDMLEIIDICSLLQDCSVDALSVVKHACRRMGDRLRRQVVGIVASLCDNADKKVRKAAFEVVLEIFEDLFKPKHSEPPQKRVKLSSSSLLLRGGDPHTDRVVECVARGITECDHNTGAGTRLCLTTGDMGTRLAECFLLAISIPASRNRSAAVCLSAFLEMLLTDLRRQERFQGLKLREEPLEIPHSNTSVSSKLLTNSRTYHGTFLSVASRKVKRIQEPTANGINVQIPINEIIGTLLEFAKDKPTVAEALSLQVIQAVLSGPGFDSRANLARLVLDVLSSLPGSLTPFAVQVARGLVEQVSGTLEFQNSLDKLRHLTKCTDGEALVTLLWEDVALRGGEDIFSLGNVKLEDMSVDVEPTEPSLNGIISAFGKLSNWDNITIQAKQHVLDEGLPKLWVDVSTYRRWVDAYEVTNTKSWFDKLVTTYRDESKQDALRWVSETDRWPRNLFHVSTVAECIQSISSEGEDIQLPGQIQHNDCLAEWAARIMMRKAYASSSDSEDDHITSSGHLVSPSDQELVWCKAANDRELPHLALNCIVEHSSLLEPTQVLPWSIEKARALRTIGLATEDTGTDRLNEALNILESSTIRDDDSDLAVIVLNKMKLCLQQDLQSITKETVLAALETIDSHTDRHNVSKKNKQALCGLYELVMTYYDDMWNEDELKCDLLASMADVLGRAIELNCTLRSRMLLSVILNRLEDVEEIDEDTAKLVLEKISLLIQSLDEFSIEEFKRHLHLFPSDVLAEFSNIVNAVERSDEEEKHRLCLQLVCDPRYSLSLRCAKLMQIKEASEWKTVFKLMKDNMFENPYAVNSTEYNLLTKYKEDLYQLEDFESTDHTHRTAILNKVLKDLSEKVTDRKTLRLSQLCPALTQKEVVGTDRDRDSLSRLLRLGKLGVVKFYEQISVFTNAITRPVVIKALLTDGTTRKYITKSGEKLRLDACVQTANEVASEICGGSYQGYTVTPLGEDSGLIEYLEDNTTFRDLISSVHDLDDMSRRLSKFIVSSSPMEKYKTYCNQIPAYTLRSAIESNCCSVEDFIKKKQHFTDTYSTLALFGSIFGLGDRHLENLLYISSSGASCCVDWAGALQYGRGELPPARITRNIVGVVGGEALEVRLQQLLSELRASHKLYCNTIKLVFKWMGDEFLEQYNYISLFVRGEATTYDITAMSLTTCDDSHKYREQLGVLRDMFGGDAKDRYTVVEQVNCLLRQCTDRRILSITREGWEAYI